MLGLHVRSLGGNRQHIQIDHQTTLATVRADLERSVPEFCEVKLFQDARELADDDVVEVELLAVVSKSPDKILAKLADTFSHYLECDIPDESSFEAAAALGDLTDQTPEYWQQIVYLLSLDVLRCSHFEDLLSQVISSLGKALAGSRNPELYIPKLVQNLGHPDDVALHRHVILLAMDHVGVNALPCQVRDQLQKLLVEDLEYLAVFGIRYIYPGCMWISIQLSGSWGTSETLQVLRRLAQEWPFSQPEVALACQKIQERCEQLDVSVGLDSRAEADAKAPQHDGSSNNEPQLEFQDAESLAQSQEVFLEETFAAMRASKEDVLKNGIPLNSDGVVILKLTKRAGSPEVAEVLKNAQALLKRLAQLAAAGSSQTAEVFEHVQVLQKRHAEIAAAGCEVTPQWTLAKLLVPLAEKTLRELEEFMGHTLMEHHIVAMKDDIPAIRQALRNIDPDYKKCPRTTGDRELIEACSAAHYPPAEDAESVVDVAIEIEMCIDTDSSLGFPTYRTA